MKKGGVARRSKEPLIHPCREGPSRGRGKERRRGSRYAARYAINFAAARYTAAPRAPTSHRAPLLTPLDQQSRY